jgi:hypothetical protein
MLDVPVSGYFLDLAGGASALPSGRAVRERTRGKTFPGTF